MKSFIIRRFPFLLLLLPVVLANEKKMCYTCIGKDSKTCTDVLKECPDGNCIKVSEEYGGPGQIHQTIVKYCGTHKFCNTTLEVKSDRDIWIRLNTECCNENKCNTGYYNMPSANTEGKGKLCPTCYAFNTLNGCTATRSSACTNEDDQCVDFRGTFKPIGWMNMDISMRGCISKKGCGADVSSLVGLQIVNQKENKCYEPTEQLPEKQSQKGLLGILF